MNSLPSIIEIGIPQVYFDPGGAILNDVEVEVHEKLKCHTEFSGTDCSTIFRNGLFDDPGYASFNGNQGFFPVLPSFGCKGVAAALWLTLARSLNVR
nr:hypothetical protein [Tanacetum cinerariifolium]